MFVQIHTKFLSAHAQHFVWDRSLAPALEVTPSEPFTVELRDAANGELRPGTSAARLRRLDFGRFWPLTGPVAVRGARPGDAVEVEIVELRPGTKGWTAIIPERGLLRDEIPGPYLHHWDLPAGQDSAELRRGIRVPLVPFLGVIGCAPGEEGTRSPLPPRATGGKLDAPALTAGARLRLPVQTPRALLSFGHGRAAQGEGEVCGSAIECDMLAVVRVHLLPGAAPAEPVAILPEPVRLPGPRYLVTGSAPDLRAAAQHATRHMIAWLRAEHRLSRELAYVLCSVAAELRIAQAVNTPNWTVTMSLPLALFDSG